MPWQERGTMSLRREFCELASRDGANVSELCRRFAISRKTGYKWLARYQAEGGVGLVDQPRRPEVSPRLSDAAIVERVLALRTTHPTWGGRKLKRRLEDQGEEAPAASTITEILRRAGCLDPAEAASHRPVQRFEHDAPNDLWQMDFKGHVAMTQRRCHPLMVADDHSRYVLGLAACVDESTETVQALLTEIFRRYGMPWRMLCDNGAPWGTVQAESGLTTLSAWLTAARHRDCPWATLPPADPGQTGAAESNAEGGCADAATAGHRRTDDSAVSGSPGLPARI